MKFAHMADVHLGSWRDPKLKELSALAFEKAIEVCIAKRVDFLLIAGDLFNNALPSIDAIKHCVKQLKKLKDRDISVYAIAGSHDYSTNGKTMLDVLEEAGLLTNVLKGTVENGKLVLSFTEDPKTGAKITGILGRRGMLDRSYYEQLSHENLEEEKGFKVFLFHTALTELNNQSPSFINSAPLALLPKHFNYYAGGHVHTVLQTTKKEYGPLAYPGPLFPANFAELEELKNGGFWIYDNGKLERENVPVQSVETFTFNLDGKAPQQATALIAEELENATINDSIVLLRLSGTLKGKTSEINYRELFENLYAKKAFFVMKNTAQLTSETLEEKPAEAQPPSLTEEKLFQEHSGHIPVPFEELPTAKSILKILATEKNEGEKQYQYEERIKKEMAELLGW